MKCEHWRNGSCGKALCDCADGPPADPLEHVLSAECWCEPEVDYVDPETGSTVYVHKRPQ